MRVFISYSSVDGLEFALDAAAVLGENSIDPWVWHRDRKSGEYTFDEIAENIRDCDYVLYICTESSAGSRGQRFERNTALAFEKDIWVITLDRAHVPPALVSKNQNVISTDEFTGECQKLVDESKRGFPNWPRYKKRRDEQIMALNRRTANLDADRLKRFRQEILRSYEAGTIIGQMSRVAEVLDPTPPDFQVITASERRLLAHFNDPGYIWDLYCSELGRAVALGEKAYLFRCLVEQLEPSGDAISSEDPDFDVLFKHVRELGMAGFAPDVICAPISIMVPFLMRLHSQLRSGSHPHETLVCPDGTSLRVFWSSKIAPLDRFVIFDSAAGAWKVKPDPESGHRLTIAIGEPEQYPDSVVWLAETVVKYEITNASAFRSIPLEGPLQESE
jgi:hypothetical protein